MNIIEAFTNEQLKKEIPSVNVGDTVRVHNKIKEGSRERIQLFEGTVIAKHGAGISATFTVRRISYGCGVEMTFPFHSPNVEKVEVLPYHTMGEVKYKNLGIEYPLKGTQPPSKEAVEKAKKILGVIK